MTTIELANVTHLTLDTRSTSWYEFHKGPNCLFTDLALERGALVDLQ